MCSHVGVDTFAMQQYRLDKTGNHEGLKMPDMGPRFVPTRFLGSGAHGQVWQCTDTLAARRVAIKVAEARPPQLVGLERELSAAIKLRARAATTTTTYSKYLQEHKHVILPYSCIWKGSHVGLVERFAAGQQLADLVQCHTTLDSRVVKCIFKQLVTGVCFCHQYGVAHLDIKAENVIVQPKTWQAALCDFGLASPNTLPGKGLVGTFGYMAPEVLQHDLLPSSSVLPYDHAAVDVWSLGAVLHKTSFGILPFGADSLIQYAIGKDLDRQGTVAQMWEAAQSASWRTFVDKNALLTVDQDIGKMLDVLLASDPADRASIADVLRMIWLDQKHTCSEFQYVSVAAVSNHQAVQDLQNALHYIHDLRRSAAAAAVSMSGRQIV